MSGNSTATPGMSDPAAAAAAAQHAMEVAQKQGQAILIWTVGMYVIVFFNVLCYSRRFGLGSV